jgi:outer membrane protein OmpA-like peptidoglycan-associated protein
MRSLAAACFTVACLVTLGAQADDRNVQSLIGQLKPRQAGDPLVTRGLPRAGAMTSNAASDQAPAAPGATPRPAPTSQTTAATQVRPNPSATTSHRSDADRPSADLNILFVTGSAALTAKAEELLNDLGRALSHPDMRASRFRIEGHTDTVGTREHNRVLSEQRAAAVKQYLVTRFSLPTDRLVTEGRGQDDLLVPTPEQTPEARNRRVHVVNLDG